ncbi:hypothetical protein Hamer_G030571, partial [Homarus americanus]
MNDELRLLELQIKLKEVGIRQAEAEAIAKRVGIRHKAEFCWTRLQPNTSKPAMIVTAEANTSPVEVMAGLSKADSMPVALVSTKVSVLASRDFDLFQESFAKDPDVGTFRPFLSQGTVEVDGVETAVTILRDSGCLQTLIKEGVVVARKTDKYVVLGFFWEGLFANPIASQDISSAVNAVTGRVALIAAQEQDDSLQLLFDQVSDSANDSGPTTRYFSQ